MKYRQWMSRALFVAGVFAIAGGSAVVKADDTAPPGREIAYVFTEIKWGIYESKDGKEECPNGFAPGPREQFKMQFPDDGKKRTVLETTLAREEAIWWPTAEPDQFPFPQAGGKTAPGLNLDGNVKPTDFTSPDGTPGVDNQLFRVFGCITNYRTGSSLLNLNITFWRKSEIDRVLIVLTDVDSLVNDDDVTLTTYRGRDRMLNDATGNNYTPGGTERLDLRFGKDFIRTAKGKIMNGVLITEPTDLNIPMEWVYKTANYETVRDARFQLKLTPERADGVIGGYFPVDFNYFSRTRSTSTHHLSYGQQAQASVYKQMRKLADAYPDPKTGENTAISGAYSVQLTQVRILRPPKDVAGLSKTTQFAANSVSPK